MKIFNPKKLREEIRKVGNLPLKENSNLRENWIKYKNELYDKGYKTIYSLYFDQIINILPANELIKIYNLILNEVEYE